MINIIFTEKEIDALHIERFLHPHPHVQKKMEALYLKSIGYSHSNICHNLRITRATLGKYLKDYVEGGIEKLKEINFYKPQSELNGHTTTIKEYFKKHPPATVAEAQNKIEELTGIKRSLTQINAFLKRIGMKCRTTGTIPGKAIDDEKIEEQESFKKNLSRLSMKPKQANTLFFLSMLHILYMVHL